MECLSRTFCLQNAVCRRLKTKVEGWHETRSHLDALVCPRAVVSDISALLKCETWSLSRTTTMTSRGWKEDDPSFRLS
uniref:Uncharacterized protein n=1 Tax=Steinernema glaseri TaxID=37863 RepID=A0A1I7Z2R2_9BILA